jgi:hypothetical protein
MHTVVQTLHDLLVGDAQNKRILRVSFPHDDGPAAQLLANSTHSNPYRAISSTASNSSPTARRWP